MDPLTTITVNGRVFNVYTLSSYNTPYYYVNELGSRQHFMTLRRLKNAIARAMRKGVI